MDTDIFTVDDPSSYLGVEYLGRGEHEVYDSRKAPMVTI